MAEIDTLPTLIITLGVIALLMGVMGSVLTNFQEGIVLDSDYISATDTNVTFTDGYATLSYDECTSIDSVMVP